MQCSVFVNVELDPAREDWEEILARLPTSVRDFLLHIAILSRLDAAVCQAVTAEPTTAACQHMLSFLERQNLGLVPSL
jgi:LuxR family transcriptional regulator, maltose regulon positive regulatory protein